MSRKRIQLVLILCILIALSSLLVVLGVRMRSDTTVLRDLPNHPRTSVWYRISPPDAVDSTGDSWHGLFRLGTENRVLISFMGGGFSINEDSAQREEDFYYHSSDHDEFVQLGITSQDDRNPFRDWTMIVLPHSTADFHVGTADFAYEDMSGQRAVLHHHGYLNYSDMMEIACSRIDSPDTVLITGWSAGGFGAAMLANSILRDYFPDVDRSVVLVDSAVLSGDWPAIVEGVWHAPQKIAEPLKGSNLTLDSLQYLSYNYPETTILFTCSCRDVILSRYQNYLISGEFYATKASRQVFRTQLQETVAGVLALGNSGVFIWDDHPEDSLADTGHISIGKRFFADTFDGTTISQWLSDAVDGSISSHGLELLEP